MQFVRDRGIVPIVVLEIAPLVTAKDVRIAVPVWGCAVAGLAEGAGILTEEPD